MSEDGRVTYRPADPCLLVLFGATGDLAKRKLLPALFNLAQNGLLAREFSVVGMAREDLSHEEFRRRIGEAMREFGPKNMDPALWARLESCLYYARGQFGDPEAYKALSQLLEKTDREGGTQGNYLYYLATPPSVFPEIAAQLGRAGLAQGGEHRAGWTRMIVEKPFGRDLDSARALNRSLLQGFDEDQLYRIDHYLGKETVQNLLVFRFANGIFEPIWNRRYIDHIQILVAESVGVEDRGRYYEEAGVLRDMIQNHMFQLLALVAMEPPISFAARAVRDEKVKVLHAVGRLQPEDIIQRTVRGQYGKGFASDKPVPAYRSEPHVSPTSTTETYAALKLFVENWRWADVPFYLRSGKRLPTRETQIVIQFRRAPLLLFRDMPGGELAPNRLVVHIQPDERIRMRFQAKLPGPGVHLANVDMEFRYADLAPASPGTGYETLLYDCMTGDATLFHRSDMVEAAWTIATPILDVWQALPPRDFPNYASGTWGPRSADELIERDGRQWSNPDV